MPDTRAVIRIDTKDDGGPRKSTERVDELGDHATKTAARLKILGSAANSTSKKLLGLASSATAAGAALETVNKKSQILTRVMYAGTKMLRMWGSVLQKFITGGLKLATIALGALSVSFVGIHALFVTGRFLVKSYHVALQGLAAGAAGAAVAIGLASSAIREQQAAMFAYTGRNNKEFGKGLNQVRVNMRGLQMDAQLAGIGVETLNKAYAEIAKTKTGYLASSKSLLKDLSDFASAGQPLEEGMVKAAKVVAAIQDPKKGVGSIKAAFKELGPAAEEALKKAAKEGINTKKEFIEAMKSGKLSALGGVTGQMDAVNNTIIGQLKKYFNLIRGQFADFGQQFLPEAKVGLERIYRIITRTMQMSSGALVGWEKRGGFVDAIVNATQKVSDFYLRLIRDYLPKSEGMFNRLGQWWSNFKEGWNDILRQLRPFIDGARIIEKMFGNAWRPIWAEITDASREFNRMLQFNRQQFEKLGSTIGESVAELLTILRVFQRVIQENLPFINNMIRGLKVIAEQFTRVFKFMEGLPFFGGQLGSQGATALMLAMARGMKTARGTVVDEKKLTQTMNVQARQVTIWGTAQGAYQGFKLGSNPAIASATGGFGPLVGAVTGGAMKGGWLGPGAQNLWEKNYPLLRTANALTGGPDRVGGASGALGLSASTSSLASAATSMGSALSSSTGGLNSFTSALSNATRAVTGRGMPTGTTPWAPPTGPSSPGAGYVPFSIPGGTSSPFTPPPSSSGKGLLGKWFMHGPPMFEGRGKVKAGKGSRYGISRHFSALSRGTGRIMSVSNQIKADRDERGSKFKMDGMIGAFLLQQSLSKLSNRVGDEDIKGGLGLASAMALFSPKLAAGIAGGTFAVKSGNMGLAIGGGALAGAQIGKSFGPMGTALGMAIGTITGAIMAPINALKAKRKEAGAMVDSFFANSFGKFLVNMSLIENAARNSGAKETTITNQMKKQTDQYKMFAELSKKGALLGGKKASRQSFVESVTMGAGVGTGVGMAAGTGLGIATSGLTGGISIPAGMAGGLLLGGLLGGVAGGIGWGVQKGVDFFGGASAEDKRNRKIRQSTVKEIYAAGGMSTAQFERLTSKHKRRFAGDQEVDDDLQALFLDKFFKKSEAMALASENAEKTVNARLKLMEQMTGKSSMELVSLAQTMGVNLADSTQDFNDQLKQLGVTVVKTAGQINQAVSELATNAFAKAFDTTIRQEKAPLILDEAIKNFRQDFNQRGANATVTAEDAQSVFSTYLEQLTNAYGGDSVKAFFELERQIGTAGGLAFREINPATGKKNPLGGLGNLFFQGMSGQAINEAMGSTRSGLMGTMLPQLGAILAQGQRSLGQGGIKAVENKFKTLSLDEQERFFTAIRDNNIGSRPEDFFARFGMTGSEFQLQEISETSAAFAMAKDNAEKEKVLLEAEREVVEGMAKFFGPASENPEWWSKDALRDLFIEAGIIKEEPDTSTPRGGRFGDTTGSRLSRTLARHSAINDMVAGRRSITSAFRTHNLGSINSDHVTGRAYDLVGNQLGMYKTIVERQGGFAEFHGGSTNRHLHVVPGPGGPMGDTVSPYTRPMQRPVIPATVSRGDISVNLNVNGIGIKEAIPQIKAELERALYEYQNRS